MKAFVDPEKCTGCELCVQTCESVFSMTDEGVAKAIDTEVSEEDQDACRDAAQECPAEAIKIDE